MVQVIREVELPVGGYCARVSKFGLGKTLPSELSITSRPIQGIFKYPESF